MNFSIDKTIHNRAKEIIRSLVKIENDFLKIARSCKTEKQYNFCEILSCQICDRLLKESEQAVDKHWILNIISFGYFEDLIESAYKNLEMDIQYEMSLIYQQIEKDNGH